ncbi:MAG: LysM peptidoglycan-binding domain-containing protein, partial [Geminicoccales bacterium]
ERDGRAVIAGRAEPGALVVVRSGEQVIDRVRASRRGDWVAVPAEPLSPGDQQLSLVARRGDAPAIRSEQVVVVAVPEPADSQSAVQESAVQESAGSQSAPAKLAAAEPPVAVLLPRDGKGPGRILQAPGRLSAEDTLALMTVSYDESGKVLLSGKAPPGVPVRIYVDNRPAALVVGDVKGDWASSLDDTLAPGTYTLRLDQLDDKGQPVARIETPFTRVSDPPVEGQLQVDYVVVQPGNSLWRIARRLSGEGLDYLHIYDTNQSQIRDPDLIYPGQVFEIPVEVGSAG